SSHPPAPPWLYTLSLHDALPILVPEAFTDPLQRFLQEGSARDDPALGRGPGPEAAAFGTGKVVGVAARGVHPAHTALYTHLPLRSEEHTSELQSRENLVCRLLLE